MANDTTRILVKLTGAATRSPPPTALPGSGRCIRQPPATTLAPHRPAPLVPRRPAGHGCTNPWDLTHQQIAGTLNLEPSAIVFAEPDIGPHIYPDGTARHPAHGGRRRLHPVKQDSSHGKIAGPDRSPGISTTPIVACVPPTPGQLHRATHPDRPHRHRVLPPSTRPLPPTWPATLNATSSTTDALPTMPQTRTGPSPGQFRTRYRHHRDPGR